MASNKINYSMDKFKGKLDWQVQITIKPTWKLKFRVWLASHFLSIGFWIMGFEYKKRIQVLEKGWRRMNTWKLWEEKQIDHVAKDLPKRVRDMRIVHGRRDDRICGDCLHFRKLGGVAGTYYKCDLTNLSHGAGTDWRMKWPACGKFTDREMMEEK